MTWSSVYTAAGVDDNDTSTFMLYFMDTYLNSKAAWDVQSHPSNNSDYRSVKITLPNIWEGGANTSSYWWVYFTGNIDSGSAYEWRWHADRTYTSVPGDLGTYASTLYSMAADWHDFGGSWRIWESDIDAQGILVTKGKYIAFYWPGPTQWACKQDPTWDGSTYDESCIVGPFIGQIYEGLMQCGYPSDAATGARSLVPDVGTISNMGGFKAAGNPTMVAGVAFVSSSQSTNSVYPYVDSQPILPRTGADTLYWLPGANSTNADRYLTNSAQTGILLYNTETSKYYLAGNQNTTQRFALWEMGSTEPDFS